jgi:hypothetical protein
MRSASSLAIARSALIIDALSTISSSSDEDVMLRGSRGAALARRVHRSTWSGSPTMVNAAGCGRFLKQKRACSSRGRKRFR